MIDTSSNRSQIYNGFAKAFSFPKDELDTLLLSGEVELTLRELATELPFDCLLNKAFEQKDCVEQLNSGDSLSILYSSTFEVGNSPVSFHETSYSSEDNKKVLEDLFRFYEYFGLNFENQKLINTPDWLISELEFLHYLSFIESNLDGLSKKNTLQLAQLDFLNRHLGQWIQTLSKNLIQQKIPVYSRFSILLADFVAADQLYLSSIIPTIEDE